MPHVDVIVDMITVSSNNCPQNYEPYTSASWVGTKEGCLCATTLNSYDFIHVIPVIRHLVRGNAHPNLSMQGAPKLIDKNQYLLHFGNQTSSSV
jgi:hypothetical protein